MTRYLLIAILCLGALYGLREAWPLIEGPSLIVSAPANNASFPDGIVTVQGKALRVSQLTLNGAPLLHEEDGSFETALTFPPGASILTLIATDRFGRHRTETRTIFVSRTQ